MTSTFNHCGGDVYWSGHRLDERQIGRLAQLFDREVEIALRGTDLSHLRSARGLRDDLAAAVALRNRWARASGPIHSPNGA